MNMDFEKFCDILFQYAERDLDENLYEEIKRFLENDVRSRELIDEYMHIIVVCRECRELFEYDVPDEVHKALIEKIRKLLDKLRAD